MKKHQGIQQLILTIWFSAFFLAAGSSACAQYFGSDIQLDSHNSEGYQRAHSAGDIDNNGSPDIVGEDAGHTLFVTRDLSGTPLYEPQSHLAAEASELYGTALVDLDGDGDLDLVTAGPNGADDSPNNVYFWDNTAKRYEKVGSTFTLFSQAIYGYDVLAGDFNNDGKPDVLWLGYNAAYLAINSTTSQDTLQFSSFTSTPLSDVNFTRGAMGSALGDFNGDGNLDFITCKSDWLGGGYYDLGFGDGSGGFTVENGGNSSDGLQPAGVAAGDLDKDGNDEFVLVRGVWGGSSEMLVYKRNAANNGFDITTVRTDSTAAYWGVVVADINSDTWPDILFEPDSSGDIAIHLNQQDGTFLAANDTRFYASHYQFFIFDMNSDGMQDLILSENTIYYKLQVLLQAVTTDEIRGYDGESGTATGYGTITSTGGNAITERGLCHNTTGNPSLEDGSCYGETGSFPAESFSMTIWGLEPNNTYYIRAYAVSEVGTVYGGEKIFLATNVADIDGDGVVNAADNCPSLANPQQADADEDGLGDLCDTTPGCGGCGQPACEQSPVDTDEDDVLDVVDTCPTMANPLNLDADADGIGDVCDTNPGCGGDGQPVCESFDSDGDGTQNYFDNCPAMANPGQFDADADGRGDACDPAPGCGGSGQPDCEYFDTDGDGIENRFDNCPAILNRWQRDTDGDGAGDACDATPGCGGAGQPFCEYFDTDRDGLQNRQDNCPAAANPLQRDADGDGTGDVCDPTPGCGWAGQPGCEAMN